MYKNEVELASDRHCVRTILIVVGGLLSSATISAGVAKYTSNGFGFILFGGLVAITVGILAYLLRPLKTTEKDNE